MKEIGLIKKIGDGLKVLGHGELNKKLTVKATKLTKTAQDKINAAGGSVRGDWIMLETFKNAWRIEDLRKKILYTLLMLLVYRIGTSFIPGLQGWM